MTNKITRRAHTSSGHIIEDLAASLSRGEAPGKSVTTSDGTARRKGGKATAIRILGAALEVLLDEKIEQFSLRAAADKAGVKLANVQYYYGNRDELLNALFAVLGDAYKHAYLEAMEDTPSSPTERLTEALRIQIADARHHTTRKLFVRLWSLLEQMSGFNGEGLRKLYQFDLSVLQELIRAADETTTAHEAGIRATIVAAMIEGSLVVAPTGKRQEAEFSAAMLKTCLQVTLPDLAITPAR